jgi:hypothetical protein
VCAVVEAATDGHLLNKKDRPIDMAANDCTCMEN